MRLWIGRLRRMTASDWLTAADTLVLAVLIEVAIKAIPFSDLLARLRRQPPAGVAHDPSAAAREYQRLLRFVAVAYEILPLPATCLRRSLVLYALLQRRGVPSRFCVGVAGSGAAFAAHAWIECDGAAHRQHIFAALHSYSKRRSSTA